MKQMKRTIYCMGAVLACAGAALAGPIPLTGAPYTQDFNIVDGVPILPDNSDTGNWTNDSTIPGWHLIASNAQEEVTPVTTLIRTNGSSATGGYKNYAENFEGTVDPERALGSVANDTFPGAAGGTGFSPSFFTIVHFVNDTGVAIDSLRIQYAGEQWRIAASQTASHDIRFDYAIGTPSNLGARTNTAGWSNEVTELRFVGPQTNDAENTRTGAINGNLPENREELDFTITGIVIEPGQEFYVRWRDLNNSGIDHGLAIDDITISYTLVPEPSMLAGVLMAGAALLRRRR